MRKIRSIIFLSFLLLLIGCQTRNQIVSIDNIQLQINQFEVKQMVGVYLVDSLTGNLNPDPVKDMIEINITGVGTTEKVSDLEKIGDWQIQLIDGTGQEFKLNDIKLSYQNNMDDGEIQFQFLWLFIGNQRSDSYTLNMPEDQVLEFSKVKIKED
jgi:hypothetical protein